MPSKQYAYLRARKENAISNLFMTGTIIIDHYLHREKEKLYISILFSVCKALF